MVKFCEAVADEANKDKITADDTRLCDTPTMIETECSMLAGAVGTAAVASKEQQEAAQKLADDAQKKHADRMDSVGLTSTTGAAVLAGSVAFALVAAMLQ